METIKENQNWLQYRDQHIVCSQPHWVHLYHSVYYFHSVSYNVTDIKCIPFSGAKISRRQFQIFICICTLAVLLLGTPCISLDFFALFWSIEATPVSMLDLSNRNTVGPKFVCNLDIVLMNATSHYVLILFHIKFFGEWGGIHYQITNCLNVLNNVTNVTSILSPSNSCLVVSWG